MNPASSLPLVSRGGEFTQPRDRSLAQLCTTDLVTELTGRVIPTLLVGAMPGNNGVKRRTETPTHFHVQALPKSSPSPWPLIQKTKTCGLTNRITHHSIAWHSAAQEMASSVRCSPSTPPRPLPSITELRRGRSEPKRSEQSPSTTMELELALPL